MVKIARAETCFDDFVFPRQVLNSVNYNLPTSIVGYDDIIFVAGYMKDRSALNGGDFGDVNLDRNELDITPYIERYNIESNTKEFSNFYFGKAYTVTELRPAALAISPDRATLALYLMQDIPNYWGMLALIDATNGMVVSQGM